MASNTLQWERWQVRVKKALRSRAHEVGKSLVNEVRADISRPNPTGKDPSLPGEPPKRVTGFLQESIGYDVKDRPNGISIFIGVQEGGPFYGRILEEEMDRPFVGPVVDRNRQRIVVMLRG